MFANKMDISLDEYIASNKELQEAIHCAKLQFSACKRDDKSVIKEKERDGNKVDDDAIEILFENDEELREIWQGPASKQAYLSLNQSEDADFDEMYKQLNNDLGKVALGDEKKDLNRPILGVDTLSNDRLPAVHSQQWRLRAPNIGSAHPPGMPPLVPVCLLDEKNPKNYTKNGCSRNILRNLHGKRVGQGSNQFKNNSNNRTFVKNYHNKNGGPFTKNNNKHRNSRDYYFQKQRFNGNLSNCGNRAQYASTSTLQSNMPIINTSSTENIFSASLNSSNAINLIPVGKAPFFINTNIPNNLALNVNDFIDNGFININPLGCVGPVGLNVVAVSPNADFLNNICSMNNETELLLGRDNLNGVRNYGVIRNQQNAQFLRRALNMTVNSLPSNQEENKNDDVEGSVMNTDESSSLNVTSTQLVNALKDLFKDGIQIKLST